MKQVLVVFIILFWVHTLTGEPLSENTGDYICQIAKEKNKLRLAFMPFEDSKALESGEADKIQTRVMARVLKCGNGIQVSDRNKLDKVLNEQILEKSGVFDSSTVPELGRLVGADSLVFCAIGRGFIQVKVVDAESGELVGADVQESASGKLEIKNKEKNVKPIKVLDDIMLRKALNRISKNRPGIYVYLTSTDEEWKELETKYPVKTKGILKRYQGLAPKKQENFRKARMQFLEKRKNSESWVQEYVQLRSDIILKKSGD